MMCETMSRTDQPGNSVARLQSLSGSGETNSNMDSMEWVQASTYGWS